MWNGKKHKNKNKKLLYFANLIFIANLCGCRAILHYDDPIANLSETDLDRLKQAPPIVYASSGNTLLLLFFLSVCYLFIYSDAQANTKPFQ